MSLPSRLYTESRAGGKSTPWTIHNPKTPPCPAGCLLRVRGLAQVITEYNETSNLRAIRSCEIYFNPRGPKTIPPPHSLLYLIKCYWLLTAMRRDGINQSASSFFFSYLKATILPEGYFLKDFTRRTVLEEYYLKADGW